MVIYSPQPGQLLGVATVGGALGTTGGDADMLEEESGLCVLYALLAEVVVVDKDGDGEAYELQL